MEFEDSKTAKLAIQKLQNFLFDPKRKLNLIVKPKLKIDL
jgi:hypothetical protein